MGSLCRIPEAILHPWGKLGPIDFVPISFPGKSGVSRAGSGSKPGHPPTLEYFWTGSIPFREEDSIGEAIWHISRKLAVETKSCPVFIVTLTEDLHIGCVVHAIDGIIRKVRHIKVSSRTIHWSRLGRAK